IAYVDDLVLISKSPHELQAMLNTCQSWCEKSRVEINLEKTKIMIFNSRLQQTHNHPSHSWSITAQYLPRDHPQKTTTLKVVDSFKYQYSVFSNCSSTVTVSPSGPRKLFKGVTVV
ncbi:MAG: reverse transcriptase domain-containing protein, partial [bacterium]